MAPGGNSGERSRCQPAGAASSRDWERREPSCRQSGMLPAARPRSGCRAAYADHDQLSSDLRGRRSRWRARSIPWSSAIAPLLQLGTPADRYQRPSPSSVENRCSARYNQGRGGDVAPDVFMFTT